MKKALAIVLLIFGGAVTVSFITALTMIFFFIIALILPVGGDWALYAMIVIFLFLASYSFKYPREYIKKKYNINSAVFVVCICAPSLIAAEAANLLYSPPDTGTNFTARLALWLGITGVFTFWMIVHACTAAYKKHRDKNA